MSNKEPEDNIPDVIPADIVRKVMQETAAEMTRVRTAQDFIEEGFAFLQEKSGRKFSFGERAQTHAESVILGTNLRITQKTAASSLSEALNVSINARGEISTNAPEAGNPAFDAPAAAYEPSQEDKDLAASEADHYAALNGGLSQEAWQEAYDDSLEESRARRERLENKTHFAPTTATAALTTFARRAVLQGYISYMPAVDNPTAAQQAILDGIQQGMRQHEVKIKALRGAAKPFLSGLELLQSLSDGKINVTYKISLDQGYTEIRVDAAKPFKTQFIKINTAGKIQLADAQGNYKSHEYDSLEGQDIKLLEGIAKAAVYAGKVSSASGVQVDAAESEKIAVLKAIHAAQGEREMARVTASYITDGLAPLKEQLGELFNLKVAEHTGRADLVLTINPGTSSALQMTVNSNGRIKIHNDEYNAFDADALTRALAKITRTTLLKVQPLKAQNNKRGMSL